MRRPEDENGEREVVRALEELLPRVEEIRRQQEILTAIPAQIAALMLLPAQIADVQSILRGQGDKSGLIGRLERTEIRVEDLWERKEQHRGETTRGKWLVYAALIAAFGSLLVALASHPNSPTPQPLPPGRRALP